MSIRLLAIALATGASLAVAAPPNKPKDPPADQPTPTEAIDVDALARSKDVGADGDAAQNETAPQDATPAEPPQNAEPRAEAAPSEAAPAEAAAPEAPAPSAETAAPAESEAENAAEKSVAASCRAHASSLLDDAQKADYAGATKSFDAKMRTAMPPPKLKEAWESLARFGKLNARGQSHLGKGEGYTIVMIPLIFDKANLVAQIACGSDGRIAGFYVKPLPKPES